MGKNKKLGLNVFYMTAGNMASKLLSFLLIPLYTAALSTSEYGIADLMTTTITLISPILTLQINEAVMRFCLDKGSDKKKILNIGFTIVSFGFCVLLLCTPFALLIIKDKLLIFLFLMYYISITMYNLLSQYTKGIEKVKHFALGGVLNTVIVIASNLFFLVYLKIGLVGYIISFILGNGLVSVYLFIASKSYKDLRFAKLDKKLLNEMIKYSSPMIPNSISWWITNSSDKYMVLYFISSAANGIYSIAYKIPSLLSTINSIFMSAWNISAVEDFGSDESKKFFSNIYSMISTLDFVVVSSLILLSKTLAFFLYSNEFFVAWKISVVLVIGFLFSSLSSFLGSVYTASKKTNALFYTSVIGAGVNILLNLLLIPKIGVVGAALATTISYVLVWIIRVIHTNTIFGFRKSLIKSGICFSIIIIQAIVTYSEFPYYTIYSCLCLIVIIIINFTLIFKIIKRFIGTRKRVGGHI